MIYSAIAFIEPVQFRISIAREARDLVESLSGYAWPLVVLVALLWFQKSIAAFLKTLSLRAEKIELGPIALNLPEVQKISSDSVARMKTVQTDEWQESSGAWFREFSKTTAKSEYAELNLGNGDEWITSRLFIFAVMMQRIKALKCVVFNQVLSSGERRYLGCAAPDNIRWALAVDQPWLEAAYANAYPAGLSQFQSMYPFGKAVQVDGALDGELARDIVGKFISSLKSNSVASVAPPPGWIEIRSGTIEHASWITEPELQRLLGIHLWRDCVEDHGEETDEQRKLNIKSVAFKSAPFVALLKDNHYRALVDRIALLSQIGQSVL